MILNLAFISCAAVSMVL